MLTCRGVDDFRQIDTVSIGKYRMSRERVISAELRFRSVRKRLIPRESKTSSTRNRYFWSKSVNTPMLDPILHAILTCSECTHLAPGRGAEKEAQNPGGAT